MFSAAVLAGAAVAIPIGRYADRYGIRNVLALGGSLVGGGFLLFAAATAGAVFGALIPVRTVVMGDWFAGARFGALMGLQATAIALGRAAGPAVTGWLGDSSAGYPVAMALLSGMLVAAAVCVYVASRQVCGR